MPTKMLFSSCATTALGMAKIFFKKGTHELTNVSSEAIFMESRPTRQAVNPVRLAPTITTSVSRACAVSSLYNTDSAFWSCHNNLPLSHPLTHHTHTHTHTHTFYLLQLIKRGVWLWQARCQ